VDEDFGEDLVEGGRASTLVTVLAPEAVAVATYQVAVLQQRGDLAVGHLDAVPLPAPQAVDAGPARLQFHGQTYPLRNPTFSLGRHADCDLVFDSTHYPALSVRHCELALEQGAYVLRDHSRHGTLVNDRPVVKELVLQAGDWIRLTPGGPLLRFLGTVIDQRKRVTTAQA
jgi:hypothetical protein